MPETVERALPLVAIVGRPNVGKSTLFNRLAGERLAIVESVPGVTRDRLYAGTSWRGRDLLVVDTGGITDSRDSLDKQVTDQALLAAAEADLVVFVVDARAGLVSLDREIAALLRRIGRPTLLLVNKAERLTAPEADFFPLGFGQPLAISAEHGTGIGDLLDRVVEALPAMEQVPAPEGIAVAVVGRPNVGKSSLVNALLGESRLITSDRPGTTRDAIDTRLESDGQVFTLIDTAGIRRSARIEEKVEYYGVLRAIRAMERSEVALVVLDATDPGTVQDQRIAGLVQQAGKACLILVNKWDLVRGEERHEGRCKEKIFGSLGFLDYAPVLFVSARIGSGVERIMPAVAEVAAENARRIPTARLNEVLNEAVLVHEPPSFKGRKLKLYYAAQVHTKPPLIAIQVNDPELLHFSYQRYLENRFRAAFGFKGTPLKLRFNRKK